MAFNFTPGELGISKPFNELVNLSSTALNTELDAYRDAGASHVRLDVYFDQIKPTSSGAYNWTNVDRVVDAAVANGLQVIGILNGKPSWVGSGYANASDKTAFGAFAGDAETHFGSKIDAWEIYNEPNLQGITASNYAGMLDAAHDAIKAVDSTSTVITGGLSPVPTYGNGANAAATYLSTIYANGGASNSDAIGFHPYSHPLDPTLNNDPWNGWEMMQNEIRGVMSANGDSASKIWITEYSGGPTNGNYNPVTEANQATYLQHAIDDAQAQSWAGPMSIYSWKDRGGSTTDSENWFGMIRPDGSEKPSQNVFEAEALNDGPTPPPVDPPADPPPGDTPTFTTANYTGTSANETIIGNDQANIIDGGYGNDTIKGGLGDDRLIGHVGSDTLTGGGGNDRFDWNLYNQFGPAGTPDKILDFTAGDRIDVYDLDANANSADGNQAFTFVGSNWLSAPGQVGAYQDAANNITYVQFNTDSDLSFDYEVVLTGVHTLTASSFVL